MTDPTDHSWCGCLERKDRDGNIDPCDIALRWMEDQQERETMGSDRFGHNDRTRELNVTISVLAGERQELRREREELRRSGAKLADAVRPLCPRGSLRLALDAWDDLTGKKAA